MSFTTLDDFLLRASDRLDPIRGEGQLPEVGDLDFVDDDRLSTIQPAAVLFRLFPGRVDPPRC